MRCAGTQYMAVMDSVGHIHSGSNGVRISGDGWRLKGGMKGVDYNEDERKVRWKERGREINKRSKC
jgi:hypothetical protein